MDVSHAGVDDMRLFAAYDWRRIHSATPQRNALTCRDGCAFLSGEGSPTDTATGLRCVRSSFRLRNGRRPHSQNDVATATIPAVVHVESAGSEPCGLDRCLNPEHADVAKVDEADAAGTV
jgi:hypothetical protein